MGTPHNQARRLTPLGRKRTLSGRKLGSVHPATPDATPRGAWSFCPVSGNTTRACPGLDPGAQTRQTNKGGERGHKGFQEHRLLH